MLSKKEVYQIKYAGEDERVKLIAEVHLKGEDRYEIKLEGYSPALDLTELETLGESLVEIVKSKRGRKPKNGKLEISPEEVLIGSKRVADELQ